MEELQFWPRAGLVIKIVLAGSYSEPPGTQTMVRWVALLESGEGRLRKTHFETKSSTNKRSLVLREIIQS